MELLILLKGQIEIQEIFNDFEKRNPETADHFISEFDRTLELIASNPEMGPVYRGRFRRKVMTKFPVGICYAVEQQRIVITTVFRLGQDERRLKSYLDGL